MTELPAALRGATSAIVADALDALGHRHQVMDARLAPVDASTRLVGRAYPVSVVEDDSVPEEPYEGEMSALGAMPAGAVGVYGGPSPQRPLIQAAAWGELFSCAAIGRGVAGVVVDGYVRDTRQISDLGFPVFAVGRSPLDTLARARVDVHGEPVHCGGRLVRRDDVVVADVDGVVLVPAHVADEVADFIAHKHRLEQDARNDLMAGASIREVWRKYEVF